MRASLIATVLNEENTIEEFLDSAINQTKKPNELIIVDGGSTDRTYEILKKYAKKYKWIKIFQVIGATVGSGRNFAIQRAKNEIIVCTDAGCILDKDWVKEITQPFLKDRKVDVVVGIYKPHYTNDFEYFQGLVVVPEPEKINSPSRMSSRSIAFKKSCWKKVNGYPDLNTGEDTMFNLKLQKARFNFEFAKDAIVYWRMRKNWKEFAKQFYKYGIGDRKSGNLAQMKLNFFLVFGFYFYIFLLFLGLSYNFYLLISLLSILFSYLIFSGLRLYGKTKRLSSFFYGPALILLKRVSYVIGASVGR